MSETLCVLFGRRVARARAAQGMTQPALATRLGVHQSRVSHCELGTGARSGEFGPRLDTILRYARALGVSPCELIPDAEEEQP